MRIQEKMVATAGFHQAIEILIDKLPLNRTDRVHPTSVEFKSLHYQEPNSTLIGAPASNPLTILMALSVTSDGDAKPISPESKVRQPIGALARLHLRNCVTPSPQTCSNMPSGRLNHYLKLRDVPLPARCISDSATPYFFSVFLIDPGIFQLIYY